MIEEINACSINEAFTILDNPDFNTENTVILTKLEKDVSKYEGLGVNFCYIETPPGKNSNKIKTSVRNKPSGVTKKWANSYIAVWDSPNGKEIVPDSFSNIKKECIDKTRGKCEEEIRNAYIIVGKSLTNAKRLEAEVIYMPSADQEDGNYTFIK